MLNEAQKLHFRMSCQYIDKLLQDIIGVLHANSTGSPFPRYRVDISPAQERVLEDFVRRFRVQLVRSLAWQRIEPSRADIPATHAVSTYLQFIDIALADLRPSVMRGSGALSVPAAAELSGVVQELASLSRSMTNYVRRDADRSLSARIKNLEGEDGLRKVLSRLEEVIQWRGMVEFHPRLDLLLSRIEDRSFEVAVFGRVSSGKSSFINALLGTELLPVGVTPITAVPTRIRYGQNVSAFLRFGSAEAAEVSLEEFRSLISEQGNSCNRKTVTYALLALPSASCRSVAGFSADTQAPERRKADAG